MSFTRYWKTTLNKYDDEIINTVKNIVAGAEKDFGIVVRGPDGSGEPIINKERIALNGDIETEQAPCTFAIHNGEESGAQHCKTEEMPYDIVVNAIGLFLEEEGIIDDFCADYPSQEDAAEIVLKKAMRQRNKFALEIYDKDNDVYETIAENDDINILREKAIAIADKNPTMNSGEPVDWFLITDCVAETPIEYFDMYEKAWKKYHQ